jgi:CRISPR-associated protein Cas1
MQPLLISGFGTSVNVERRRLIITNKLQGTRLEVWPHQAQFDSIVVDVHSGMISFEALRWILKNGISLITLNWNGNLLSTTLPRETANANLRVRQYERYLDDAFRRKVAQAILDEKIRKSLGLLLQLSSYYPVLDKDKIMKSFNETSQTFKGRPELLTYEGNIAILYWVELQRVFAKLCPQFNFTNRNGRRHSWNMNASDEINALLNYGYALLEAQVRKTVNSIGLDSTIGFGPHELQNGRDSLIYDLMEPFRWLIDLSVIQLLEEKKLRKSDFIVTENYHIRLRESAAKALIEKVKVNFNMKVNHKGKNWSYEQILLLNIRALANHIEGKTSTFNLNIPDLELNRIDDVDLRSRIMGMTIEERKRLGIRRNTLFYMKKNIAEGKRIKVYKKIIEKLS